MSRFWAYIIFAASLAVRVAGSDATGWIRLPEPSESRDPLMWPMRLTFAANGTGSIEVLFAGIRRHLFTIRDIGADGSANLVGEGEGPRSVQIRRDVDILTMIDAPQQKSYVFRRLPDWEIRFAVALAAPTTKDEALAALAQIVGPAVRKMKKEELFSIYALGYTHLIDGALGLRDRKNAALRKQLTSKSGDMGFDLFLEYWETAQHASEPNKSPEPTSTRTP